MSESTRPDGTFNFGWNAERNEFALWQRTRIEPIAFVSLTDALALAATVQHVTAAIEPHATIFRGTAPPARLIP